MEYMSLREVFIYQSQELFSYACSDSQIKGWVVPNDLPLVYLPAWLVCVWFVGERVSVSALLQSFLIWRLGVIKMLLVARNVGES